MRKFHYILFIFLFVAIQTNAEKIKINKNDLDVKVVVSNEQETILEFSFGNFEAIPIEIEGKVFNKLILEKGSHLKDKGFPELPIISRSIIIPDDKKATLTVLQKVSTEYQMGVLPSKGIIYRDQDPNSIPYEFNEVYNQNIYYPANIVETGDPYILRDFRGINIKAFPFSYNPVSGILKVYHKIRFKVSYSGKGSTNVKERKDNKISSDFESIYKNHFLNYESGGKYPTVGESGRMIVICHNSFMDEIAPFVEWKIQKGIPTDLYDVAAIGATNTSIQTFIQNQYNSTNGVTFVQLVGDAAQVPTFSFLGGGSDPTYSLVDGADSYPDIIIGRFSAEAAACAQTQVDRTIHYERDLSWGGWLYDGTGIASEEGSGAGWQGFADWEHMDYLRNMLLNFNYTTIDQFYGTGTPTAADVTNALNAGRGILNYCGHGSTSGWATTGFNSDDVNNLENDYKLPFIHSVGCVNGNFVSTTCFAEAWLRATNNSDGDPTGGIAMYASSINQSWAPPMIAQDYSTQHIVDEDYYSIGALWYNGSCAMIDIDGQWGIDMFMTWHIFGDASLAYRTKTPSIMSVSHSTAISNGQSTFSVNTDEPGALVSLSCSDQVIASGYANGLGDITLNLPSSIPCPLPNLTVTAYNKITYTSTIITEVEGYWEGDVSSNWHTGSNWASGSVPNNTHDVIIPAGCSHYPIINSPNAECDNLNIESGGSITIGNTTLTVEGNATISGNLAMNNNSSQFHVDGDITWESGSTANITNGSANIVLKGHWIFNANSSVHLDNGFVTFIGPYNRYIRCYSSDSYFKSLVIAKDPSIYVYFSSSSTHDLSIKGNLFVNTDATFRGYADRKIIVDGLFDCDGIHYFSSSTFVFNGPGTTFSSNTSSFFNHLEIKSTGEIDFNTDLEIRGNLIINNGSLAPNGHTITIDGNWENNVGGSGFDGTTGTVVFAGDSDQYIIEDENFNILEIDKSGGSLIINHSGIEVSCNQYNWTQGMLHVQSGNFTANDLYDDGIYGQYTVDLYSTITLMNFDGYADLNGHLFINGGSFDVYGGSPPNDSFWSYGADASITMSSGIIDFHDVGIVIYNGGSYSFSENITGGKIKTTGDFICNRTDFNLSGGEIVLYGPDDAILSQVSGSTLYDVTIDKGMVDNVSPGFGTNYKNSVSKPVTRKKQGVTNNLEGGKSSKGNRVSASTELDINGDLSIEHGEFDLNGNKVDVSKQLFVYSTLTMININDELWVDEYINFEYGAMGNISDGLIAFESRWTFADGTDVQIGPGNTAMAIGLGTQLINNDDDNSCLGKLNINQQLPGLKVTSTGSQPVRIAGDLTLQSDNTLNPNGADFIVNGTSYIPVDALIKVEYGGSFETDGNLDIYGSIHLVNGTVTAHGDFYCNHSGSIIIEAGDFIIDKSSAGGVPTIDGYFEMSDGNFEVTYDELRFQSNSSTLISGGEISTGGTLSVYYANTFQPTGGSVRMTGTDFSTIIMDNSNYFHDLIINKAGTTMMNIQQPIIINNDLTMQTGTFNTNSHDITVIGDVIIESNGKLDPDLATIFVEGDWTNNNGPSGFVEGTALVSFIGNDDSHIYTDETFYNLEVNKTGTIYTYLWTEGDKTINVHDIIVSGCSFRLHNNSILNVANDVIIGENTLIYTPNDEPSYINIEGNWYNQNTTGNPFAYGFWSGISTVTFIGSGDQYVEADYGTQEFYNLVIDKTTNYFYPACDLVIKNDAVVTDGTWGSDVLNNEYSFHGNITIEADGAFDDNSCTVNILGSGQIDLFNNGISTTNFGHLNIQMTTISSKDLPVFTTYGDIHCDGDIMVDTGNFVIDSQTLECMGNFDISENGKVTAPNQSIIAMGDGGAFSISGGILEMHGNGTLNPKMTSVTGYYEFTVINNGLLSTSNTTFEYMDVSGVRIYTTGLVYGTNAFSNCTFQNGATGGTLLTINNDQDLVINNANFPTNTWGGTYNVAKTSDQGSIAFTNETGAFAGSGYENDPDNRISWGSSVPGIWTGAVSHSWNTIGNWQDNLKPTASDDVYIPAGTPNDPWVATTDQECNNLTIEAGAYLRVYDEILTVHGNMIIYGELRMDNAAGVLNVGDWFGEIISWEAGSTDIVSSGTINVFGDWYFKNGTDAQLGAGNTVNFYGTNRSYIYCDDDNASFGNIDINKSLIPKDYVQLSAGNTLRVSENLYVYDGMLILEENTNINVGNEFYIDNGCTLSAIGTAVSEVTISGSPNYCVLDINNGATISAEYAIFEYLESNGVAISPTAIIDPAHPFNHCTFRESPAGGSLLTIANNQTLTIDGAIFPPNYWSGGYNVSKINDAGHITFTNVDGGFVGSYFEEDPYNRVDWPGVVPGIWTGEGNSLWNVLVNWKYQLKPTASDDVIIPAGTPHNPRVTLLPQECNSITIEAGASLEIYNQTLTVHDELIITGELIMNHSASVLNAGDIPGSYISWEPGSTSDITYGTINTYGDWYFKNGTDAMFSWGNTVVFYGSHNSTIYCDDPDATFGNMTVNKTSSPKNNVFLPANNILRVAEDFYMGAGIMNINESSIFEVGNEIYVDAGCRLNAIGTATNKAVVTGTASYCLLEIASGGFIGAEYAEFQYLESGGVVINPGAIIDPIHPFNYCTFQESPPDGTLLTISNDQVLTIDGVTFPENTWGGGHNVSKNIDQGHITFTNVQGTFVGEDYEDDPNSRIDWPGVVAGIWTGLVSPFWNNPENWDYHLKPDATDDVYIPYGTPYYPWVSQADHECNNIIIEAGALLRVYSKELTVHGDMTIHGQLIMDNTLGVLNAGDGIGDLISWEPGSTANISNGTINVFGDWNFKDGTSAQLGAGNIVAFYGGNLSKIHCDDADAEFGNLRIYKSSPPKDIVHIMPNNSVRVVEDLYVGDGILKVNEGASFSVGNEMYIDNGGTLSAIGIAGNEAVVSGYPSYCLFEIANGGTISAEYAIFEYLESYGIVVSDGAFVDPLHSFNHCAFQESPAGGTLLTFDNDQDIIIDGAHFPDNTWGGSYNVGKSYLDQGHITFLNVTGSFAGESYENDPYSLIDWNAPWYDLNLRVFLEGPFGAINMNTNLTSSIPLFQPFNTSPWNYYGTEATLSIPIKAVDWVLIELHDAVDAASVNSGTVIEQRAGFLTNTGYIVDMDGSSRLQFNESINNELFIVVWHRNHIGVMSAYPVVESGGVYTYDFSISMDRAYGDDDGHKEIAQGIWGMVGGNGVPDNEIHQNDLDVVWKGEAGMSGYLMGDYNLDGQVNNPDKNDILLPNGGFECQVPE